MATDPEFDTGPDTTTVVASLASHLLVALTALVAGVVTGGWIAFETGYWRGFKDTIEGLAGGGLPLVVALLAVTAVVTLLATYRQASG
jgi:uncharacterized membrane protein